jgi:hypothetical protein
MNPVEASDAAERAIRPVVVAGLRRIGPEGRLRAANRLSRSVRRMAVEAIRRRHPDWDEAQVRRCWMTQAYGADLAARYDAWLAGRAARRAG